MARGDPVRDGFEADFETLYENAPLAYHSLDGTGRILLVNSLWLDLFGRAREDVVGRHLTEFLTPPSREKFTNCFTDSRRAAGFKDRHFEMTSAAGEVIPVRIQGRSVSDAEDHFLRSHCVVQDMRTEVAALEARDRSEGRYRRLVELAREGIWEIDAEAVTVYANPAMAAMLEYTQDEMIGMHLFDFMDDEGRRVSERNLKRRERGIEEQHDFQFITKNGLRIYTTLETSPIHDPDGTYSGAVAGVIDVTERRRFDSEMLQTQKLESLGVLAGGIAHDFNNLLQAVIGNAELALTDLEENPPARESLIEIQRAAQRATDLCRQMLAYAGRTRFRVAPVDIVRLAREMSEILGVSLSKKARFSYDLADDLPLVEGDSSQLGQVIMNLITNASEALEGKEGVVRITVQTEELAAADVATRYPVGDLQPGRHIVLAVADNGCGMDPETQRNIFDPFFTTKFAGRGLGLAAVLGIVKGHGGALAVDSAPGKGTTISLALPVQPDATKAEGPSESDSVQSPQGLRREPRAMRILIAEDEVSVQRTVCRLLERLGQDVQVADNGAEAVALFRAGAGTFDLVLLDLSMPVMDGRETMKEIRALAPGVPVIISSGFPAEEISQGFGSDQPDFFLQKPYVFDQLADALVRCTD